MLASDKVREECSYNRWIPEPPIGIGKNGKRLWRRWMILNVHGKLHSRARTVEDLVEHAKWFLHLYRRGLQGKCAKKDSELYDIGTEGQAIYKSGVKDAKEEKAR